MNPAFGSNSQTFDIAVLAGDGIGVEVTREAVAREFPEVKADHCYVDAAALYLVQRPHTFDVLVTENMFGDILSDLAAGLVGGMGMAPSADIGRQHSGAVSGTMNMAVNFGSFVTTLAFPYLLDWTGSHVAFFYVAAALSTLAMLLWLGMNPHQPLESASG